MHLVQDFLRYRVDCPYPRKVTSQESISVATWNSDGFEIRYQISDPTPNEIGAFKLGDINLGLCELNDLSWICWRAAKVRLSRNLNPLHLLSSSQRSWDISWQECPFSLQTMPGENRPVLHHYLDTPNAGIPVTSVLIDLADKNRIKALRHFVISPEITQWLVKKEWDRLRKNRTISQADYNMKIDEIWDSYNIGEIVTNCINHGFITYIHASV